jgi:hypothetical protein
MTSAEEKRPGISKTRFTRPVASVSARTHFFTIPRAMRKSARPPASEVSGTRAARSCGKNVCARVIGPARIVGKKET